MAVDLTSRATYKDLTSKEGQVQFRFFIAGAKTRRARDVKALHVLQLSNGQLLNLDFGIAAPDLETLMPLCSAALLAYKPEDIIPLQAEADWWTFWTAPLIKGYMRMWCPTHKHDCVFLTVRGGSWPK